MVRQIDKRDFNYVVAGVKPHTRAVGINPLDDDVDSDPILDLDPFTGSVRKITLDATGFGAQSSRLIAMNYAQQASVRPSGFVRSDPAEFGLPQDVTRTGAGGEVVHLQQLFRGIPVFQSGRTVHFRVDGQATVTGATVQALADAESDPALGASAAVVAAARYLAEAPDNDGEDHVKGGFGLTVAPAPLALPKVFEPIQTAVFDLPAKPTVFSAEPFEGAVKASLVYFYMGPEVRLCWQVELVFANSAASYIIVVAAGENQPGEILYAANRANSLFGECAVYHHNPGVDVDPIPTAFPVGRDSLPITLRGTLSARDWIGDQPRTSGNNVDCQSSNGPLAGVMQKGTVAFGPLDDQDQYVANVFYYCNLMHDFFELLGFDEGAGNFELDHENGGSGAGDPVHAAVSSSSDPRVAWMATGPDGQPPDMVMCFYGPTGRHSALDSDVVFHEFTHGVTNRLVGGRLDQDSLAQPQSRGMGEGWSDYFALTFQNVSRQTEKVVIGDWIVDSQSGIRANAYNDAFPDGFGDLGAPEYRDEHKKGEIWCATLMRATRDLVNTLGDKPRAYAIAWQGVVDGLKLTMANPSFLDARDAILAAIDDLGVSGLVTGPEHRAAVVSFWKAFAHFGMGVNASCMQATVFGIVADTTLPVEITNEIAV